MRTGTGRPNKGTRGSETQDMGNTGLTLLPRTVHHPMGRGVGALEASRGRVREWKASRAAPVPGPMAG